MHADATSDGCAQGFISKDILQLVEQRRNVGFISSNRLTTYVVPELKFSESGLLERWIFVAHHRAIPINDDRPHFQVWRDTGSTLMAVNGTGTFSLTPTSTDRLNVYEYVLDSPVPVEAGDIVGWSQDNPNSALLRLAVIENTGYDIHQVTTGTEDTIEEMIALDFQSIPLISTRLLGECMQ